MAHPGRDPTGRDADFDWCLAFGEGARTMPADPPDPAKPELAGVELELPRTAFEWPAHGFTSAPEGHELYTPKKVAHWGEAEWRLQGEWEALPWSERRGAAAPGGATVTLLPSDGFYRMLTQYMEAPYHCPVHTLKLAFMKSGLEVEERMNDTYDVLFLIVRGDDELLEMQGRLLHEAGAMSCKRTFVRAPREHEQRLFDEHHGPDMGNGGCDGWNPFRDEYMSSAMYNYTTRSAQPDSGDSDATRWGLKMGMSAYDPDLKHHFEDRRLNEYLFTASAEYDDSPANKRKCPHPRFFHSGERQELVKAIMENVEWARYLPTKMSFEGARPQLYAYPGVKLTPDDQTSTTLMKTVAFGYPTEVTSSRRNQELVGAMKFLRDKESPMHDVRLAHDPSVEGPAELPSLKAYVCGSNDGVRALDVSANHPWVTEPTIKSWHDLDMEDGQKRAKASPQAYRENRTAEPRRMKIYPFMVDQCERLADQESHKIRNAQGSGDCDGEDRYYAVVRDQEDDSYELIHFKSEASKHDFANYNEFRNWAAQTGKVDPECPDKVREQQTFLVDCFPLHCTYERAYLREEFASYGKICSCDILSLPLDRVEGYFGSEAALYFGWLRCYTKALLVPGSLGLALQLGVWGGGGFPGSVNALQGWLIAYCVFCALWSSLFMLDWKRRQNELQHRWGLAEVEENAKPRKEFVEQLHSHKALADPADRTHSGEH